MKTIETALLDPPKTELEILQAEHATLQQNYAQIKEQLDWLLRQLFGKKSERVVSNVKDIQLEFEGFSVEQESPPPKPPSEPKPRRKPVRNGKDAITLPEDLPVRTTIIDISEKDKICKETGLPLVKIGEEVTLKLAHEPGSYFIKEIIRPKYANPNREEQGILCAELPSTIFPKCRADDSLLADIAVKKFGDHLPLYRISEIMQREGIGINRKLLSQWMGHCGSALTVLYDERVKRVLSSGNIFVDESPINIQAVGRVKKGYMWVIVGGNEANPPYRIYSFAESRAHSHIFRILSVFQGVFHSDKYAAYETLSKNKGVVWNPCWAHIRRYFFEVESGDLEFCDWVLRKIRYLYMLERVAWNRSPEERLKIRLDKEVPIIDELIQKIKDRVVKGKLLPKSNFSKALHYFMGLIPYLKNYTLHAFSRIDNNVAERAIRPLAIGRKNWLFFGTLEAGQSAAVLISLIQTCRGLGINPREYLEDIFRRIMDHSFQNLHELLPDQWLIRRQQSK
jgi:transposase